MRNVEIFEAQADEGPCLDCYRTGERVLNEILVTDGRWPVFSPVALSAGFRLVHAVPMRLRGEVIGALNLFQTHVGALDEDDIVAASALADMATIAILQHRAVHEARALADQLSLALDSRVVIEQAKGALGERHSLSMEDAFGRLRSHARRNNLRLVDVARGIMDGTVAMDTLVSEGPRPLKAAAGRTASPGGAGRNLRSGPAGRG